MTTTLTDQQLAETFPNATGVDPPESHMALFRKRTRERLNHHSLWATIVGALIIIVPASVIVATSSFIAAGIAAAVLMLVPIVFLAIQWNKAEDAFWEGYGASRGLSVTEDGYLAGDVPLFRKGDKREFERVLSGTIGGNQASLALYTYTEVSRDSDGNRQETDYDFTVVRYTLPGNVAERYIGVYVRDRGISFGKLQDALQHDRSVKFASSELNKQYSIRVDDDQDDIALYELFSTTFIDNLVRTWRVTWEQRGFELVVFEKGHKSSTNELDDLCSRSLNVVRRYLEEYQ